MIDLAVFRQGMQELAGAFNRPLTEEVLTVFAKVLAPRLSTEQWRQAVTRALEAESYFPPPAVLLRYGADDRGLAAAAGDAYTKIVRCYEQGQELGYRQVEERFGHAAAEGFIAAGGSRRFAWCEPEDEPFRLKDFRAAYVEQAEVDPISALPPGEPVKALPDKAEAKGFVSAIAALASADKSLRADAPEPVESMKGGR